MVPLNCMKGISNIILFFRYYDRFPLSSATDPRSTWYFSLGFQSTYFFNGFPAVVILELFLKAKWPFIVLLAGHPFLLLLSFPHRGWWAEPFEQCYSLGPFILLLHSPPSNHYIPIIPAATHFCGLCPPSFFEGQCWRGRICQTATSLPKSNGTTPVWFWDCEVDFYYSHRVPPVSPWVFSSPLILSFLPSLVHHQIFRC